jgi:ketosteroid isomerase-like protein
MDDVDGFLSTVIPRYIEVEKAFHCGDVEPRLGMWTRSDPVSVVGAAGPVRTGWTEVEKSFRWIAARFADCTDFDLDVIVIVIVSDVRGDLAYVVSRERAELLVDGAPTTIVLRLTHVYRREDGRWKNAHRHADSITADPMADPATAAAVVGRLGSHGRRS